jgi:hypothetical protein
LRRPPALLAAVPVDGLDRLPLRVGRAEIGAVTGEDLDPLRAGFVDGLGHQVRGVAVPPSGHCHVRRGGAGGVPDGAVGAVDGLSLGAVDGGGVGELDEPVHVLRGEHPVPSLSADREVAVLAEADHGPGLAVRDS